MERNGKKWKEWKETERNGNRMKKWKVTERNGKKWENSTNINKKLLLK